MQATLGRGAGEEHVTCCRAPARAPTRGQRVLRDQVLGRHWLARSPAAAFSAVSAIRLARVGSVRACTIHSRIARRAERGNASHCSREPARASKAADRSGGTTRFSTSSSRLQVPLALAISTVRRPAGSSSPATSSRAIRSLLVRAQAERGLRGANHSLLRSVSIVPPLLSTQPTQRASSTDSSYPTLGRPVEAFQLTS